MSVVDVFHTSAGEKIEQIGLEVNNWQLVVEKPSLEVEKEEEENNSRSNPVDRVSCKFEGSGTTTTTTGAASTFVDSSCCCC